MAWTRSPGCAQAGITDWHGGRRPDEKIARLEKLKSQGRHVLMVGDGLNDAPALAAAHASLSPASAADISQTAADGIMQGKKLGPVVEALSVASVPIALPSRISASRSVQYLLRSAGHGWSRDTVDRGHCHVTSSITVVANAIRLKAMKLELKA